MRSLIFAALISVLVSGCFGRIQDGKGQKIDSAKYGLDGQRPALIVFGAGWCKPCLAEIPALNRAQAELGSQLQIANFLVEGAQKGVPVSSGDTDLLQSPKGEKPQYAVKLDPSWVLFDALQPASGRQLPTMVFVAWDQTVDRVVQRSMEFDAELMPALRALIAGQPTREIPKPDEEEPDDGELKAMSFQEWTATPGNEPDGAVYNAFKASWEHGLQEYAFLEDDMPLNKARMTVLVYADGRVVPKIGVWNAMLTGCRLTVYVKPDGTFEKSEGICK